MTPWYQWRLAPPGFSFRTDLDQTMADHAETMRYADVSGYGSVTEFFDTHFWSHPRLLAYERFIVKTVPKTTPLFSLASGRAALEMRLLQYGYQVDCSELEPVHPELMRRLFPEYRACAFDVLTSPLPARGADGLLVMGLIYRFDLATLGRFFQRMAAMLNQNGVLIVDATGAESARWFYDLLLPLDAKLFAWHRGGCAISKHHGYRHRNQEIVGLAQAAGLSCVASTEEDYQTEWLRSHFYAGLARRWPTARWWPRLFGRSLPHVRLWAFRKTCHG